MYNGSSRSIDGIDAWPVLMGKNATLGREYLPLTDHGWSGGGWNNTRAIIWQSKWKLLTNEKSTHWFTPDDEWVTDTWPCADGSSRKGCAICSYDHPCLFDLIADPEERNNLAAQHPAIVSNMREAMQGRNFPAYTGTLFPASEQGPYQCLIGEGKQQGANASKTFWSGFLGPCCIRKGSPTPVPPPTPDPPKPTPNPPPTPPTPSPRGAPEGDLSANSVVRNWSPTGVANISGWCSGPKYSGPALGVSVRADGMQVANGTASLHRAIAGDHGFELLTNLAAFKTGAHKVQVGCVYQGTWFELKNSPVCLKDRHAVAC
jgi:hypothetical protein